MVPNLMRMARLALFCCVTLIGLLPHTEASAVPTRPHANRDAQGKTSLRLAMPDVQPEVDPAFVTDDENVELANLLYIGLVRLDSSYRIVAGAASHWSVSHNHMVYTFHLRNNLRFSNGDTLTARDFAYGINRSLSPSVKSPSAPTYLLDIKGAPAVLAGKAKSASGVHVVNAHTLQITARWPVPYLLMELTYPTAYALDRKRLEKLDPQSWDSNPITDGPYKLKTWSPNNKIVLTKNPYWSGTKPSISQITIALTPLPETDQTQYTALYQYVAQNLDVAALPASNPRLTREPSVYATNMLAADGVYMRFKSKPFDNPAVRQALTMALDRHRLVRTVMKGSATVLDGVSPARLGAPGPGPHPAAFAPKHARALLLHTPYAGKKFPHETLYYVDDPYIAKLAQAITKSWHRYLGISVDAQPLVYNALWSKVLANQVPLYLFGWQADYPDPHDWLSLNWETDALNNNVEYRNSAFDKLVETADVSWKSSRRAELYARAQQTLLDDAAWIPLYVPHRAVYVRSTVANLKLTGYGLIPSSGNWADVRLSSPSLRRQARP